MNQSPVAALWLHHVAEDWGRGVAAEMLQPCIDLVVQSRAEVFFRADDVGPPSVRQDRLLRLFVRHEVPLSAAVVPAWLTAPRWAHLDAVIEGRHDLMAWHQHGWMHRNHQPAGKKQEFGPAVSREAKQTAIRRGRDRLATILGTRCVPVFTPPWNRVDQDTLDILAAEGFMAVSRFRGAKPAAGALPDIAVNVDLHTRKEAEAEAAWAGLLNELSLATVTGRVGIMLHHRCMNEAAFAFLDALLSALRQRPEVRLVHFGHVVRGLETPQPGRVESDF